MRYAMLLGALLIVGCLNSRPLPTASTTPIPGSSVTIVLIGPDEKGHYRYDVNTADDRSTSRFLGPIDSEVTPVNVEALEDGRVRVQWGTSEYAGFCLIDVDDELIVEDSNLANQKESFASPSGSDGK